MRLIDADALFLPDENSDKVLILGGRCGSGKTVALATELLKKKVANAPTIDPESLRPKGEWGNGVCTNCQFDLRCLTDGESDLEQWVWDEGFDFCPNCGADMRGET